MPVCKEWFKNCVSLIILIFIRATTKKIETRKMENGKWKMENGKWKKEKEKENMYISINKYMFTPEIRGIYFPFYTRAR